MSDAGSAFTPSLLGGSMDDIPDSGQSALSGMIDPDWANGQVLNDAQIAAAQNSPLATSLGLDLTTPIPQLPGSTDGQAASIPMLGAGDQVSDLVFRPRQGPGDFTMTPLPYRPSADDSGPQAAYFAAQGQNSFPSGSAQAGSDGAVPASPDVTSIDPANAVIVTGTNATQTQPAPVPQAPPGSQTSPPQNAQVMTGNQAPPIDPDAQQARQLAGLKKYLAQPGIEGRSNEVYPDSRGIPTVGIGHKVLPGDNLELKDVISDDRIDQLFQQDGSAALTAAQSQVAKAGITDPAFTQYLASLNFQAGTGWTSEFPTAWQMIQDGQYDEAAKDLGTTKWYQESPNRVKAFQNALRALPPKPKP